MKVLIIHNKYGKHSGEEAVVASEIKLLKSKGHTVVNYFRSSEELETMPYGKVKAFFSGLYNQNSINDVKDLINVEKPDLVHIHNLYPLISPAILPVIKKMNIPIVMTVHNYRLLCPNGLFFNKGKICKKCTGFGKEINSIINNCEDSILKSTGYALRNYWSRMNKYYIENVDLFLCLTEFQKTKLVSNGYAPQICKVLPNFYDKIIKDISYDIKNRNYIVYSGRISPEKGISILLESARKLPNIQFKLAGFANNEYLNKIDIPKNVTFKGLLNSKELSKLYANARLLVLPSIWYEGFPMVFPEAMAHKLPIIAPDMAGYPEIVEDNINGFLFESGNAKSLTDSISKLWNNQEVCKNMAMKGFEKVQENYSSLTHYKQLIDYYKGLIVE